MKLSVLIDDRKSSNSCDSEHGLSLYIEFEDKKILVDFGQTNLFLENGKKLNIDLSNIDFSILTHGHYDHGNGINNLQSGTNIYFHPKIFQERFSDRTSKYAGINISESDLRKKYNCSSFKGIKKITDNIILINETPRIFEYENNQFSTHYSNGETDYVEDETSVVLKTEAGLIVIAGCSHPGICSIIEYAKRVSNEDRVYAVIGGFHLKEDNQQLNLTIQYFIKNKIKKIYLGHCTSDLVIEIIKKEVSNMMKVNVLKCGESFDL